MPLQYWSLYWCDFLKVLQINNVYRAGSTGKLTGLLHDALINDGFDSIVLYGRGFTVNEKNVYRVCSDIYGKLNSAVSMLSGIRYGGCVLSTHRVIELIEHEHPDIIHVQCINGNFVNIYKLIEYLKKSGIPTVLTLHAEFMYTANCGHSFDCDRWKIGCGNCPRLSDATKSMFFDRTHESFLKMSEAFSGFGSRISVVSVSPWLMERAKKSPILADMKHEVILNGVDTEIFHRSSKNRVKREQNIENETVLFQATSMFRDKPGDPKGGAFIIDLANRLRDLPVKVIIAGKYEISGKIPENVILLGEINDQNLLAEYYSMADITVLTSRRETYSMVCAESLCCGTPVMGFCAGAPEMISIPEYSNFVTYGDMDGLERCIKNFITSKKSFSSMEIEARAKERYSKEIMIRQYEDLYRRMACSE